MKPETTSFKLNVHTDLMVKLKEIALRESRSVSAQMNRMLRAQVEADAAAQK